MRAKKKTGKRQRKSKISAAAARPMNKMTQKKVAVKKKASKKMSKKKKASTEYPVASSRTRQRQVFSSRQSGDLQGLSRAEQADSESVDELIEEGNPFEASAVAGVEEADNADEREVRTHEVPEDDIPDEYFDKE